MNINRLEPARALWHGWKRLAFTSQTLFQRKQYVTCCAPEYEPGEDETLVLFCAEKALPPIPKKIWMYWDNEYLPISLRLNIEKLRKDNADHDVHVINRRTVKEVLPDFIFTSSQLTPQQKSEVIRLELLLRYGGIAIDCHTLLFEDLAWVHRAHAARAMDVIGYYHAPFTVNYLAPVMESGFIAAAPNNPFIREWQKHYAPIKHLGAKNYYHELTKRDDFALLTQQIADPQRHLGALAQQVAMREYRRVNLSLRKGEANVWLHAQQSGGHSETLARAVLFNLRPATPPSAIALSGEDRRYLDFNLRIGNYSRHSLLGAMMQAQRNAIKTGITPPQSARVTSG